MSSTHIWKHSLAAVDAAIDEVTAVVRVPANAARIAAIKKQVDADPDNAMMAMFSFMPLANELMGPAMKKYGYADQENGGGLMPFLNALQEDRGDDALRDKAAHFAQLDAVRRLPRAHAALCLEVARRRAYGVAAVAAVRGAADAVAALRDAEHERRLRFARSHGQRLPRALLKAVPALLEAPATFSPRLQTPLTTRWTAFVRRSTSLVWVARSSGRSLRTS